MPNPPTQGRKEAITKGAKALEDSRFFSATSWKAKEMFRELAQAVLDAAYPEQTERDDWGDVSRETLMATESERNTAEQRAEKAERERGDLRIELDLMTNDRDACWADRDRLQRELDDARAQHLTLSNQALDATTKVDRLQREVERLTVWASHKREHIYKVEGERDRLQRECDKLREALGDIAESGKPLNWARDIARDALEKP